MKVKQILELNAEELERMMTKKEYAKMLELNLNTEILLEALQDSAKLSGQDENEEHVTISEYLDYLEDMKN